MAALAPPPIRAATHTPTSQREYLPSQKFTEAQYVLPSDEIERERLLLQHLLLKRTFGNRLVLPPVELKAGDRILDSGTGSGTWITDFSETATPDLELYGVDIEPRLFPVQYSNINFSVTSVTALPSSWTDHFTFVNQRLLIAALTETQWQSAMSKIHRALVPGRGYVQFGEVCTWKAGKVTERHHELVKTLFRARGLLLDECAISLPKLMEEAGFVDVVVEQKQIPLGEWAGQEGVDGRDNFMGVFRGMKTPIMKAGGFGCVSSDEEFDELLDAVEKEWNETPGAEIGFAIVYGRKPEAEAEAK